MHVYVSGPYEAAIEVPSSRFWLEFIWMIIGSYYAFICSHTLQHVVVRYNQTIHIQKWFCRRLDLVEFSLLSLIVRVIFHSLVGVLSHS